LFAASISNLSSRLYIITHVVSSNPAHGEMCSTQRYVIQLVSDLLQLFGFSPVSSINKADTKI